MEAPTVTVTAPRPNGLVTVVLSDAGHHAAAVEPDSEAGSGSEEVGRVFKSHSVRWDAAGHGSGLPECKDY